MEGIGVFPARKTHEKGGKKVVSIRSTIMSIYRFSKGGRLFVQGTREDEPRENVVSSASTAATPADDLRAIYTKRRLSTEVLGRKGRLLHRPSNVLSSLSLLSIAFKGSRVWKSRHDHSLWMVLSWYVAKLGEWIVTRFPIHLIDRWIEEREEKAIERRLLAIGRFGIRPFH